MNVLGLITARGGSKGIPGKNIAPCGGRPLLAWTCDAATGARCITRAIVSTDDPAIADVARGHGVEVPFMRPVELATDSARSIDVAKHAIDELAKAGWQTDVLVLLQPTSPLRTANHVDEAFARLAPDDDAVVSVIHVPHRFAPWSALQRDGDHVRDYVAGELGFARDRRQGQPELLARNGPAVVITRARAIAHSSFYGERCAAYEMSNQDSVDIDDAFDLELADWLLRRRAAR
ncbi:MAG TPA: acylneuraminate cytidylyltransferase family protein [Polyangiales bacterium]|jgi:CMP-N-acetylneuraminic acid synthetase|nr:acylneuraminate cytidylyltransferase family protein [Polyangiales bacterium]